MAYEALWTGTGSDLLISMLEKLYFVSFHRSDNTIAAGAKLMDGSVLDGKLRCWGCLYLLNWTAVLTLSLMLKLSPRKLYP